MHSVIQNLEVKIYVVKKFKRHKIKNHSDGVCVRSGRPDRTHTPQVQNYAAKHRPSIRQNICKTLRVISFKHSSVLPDDGSHTIRNMSE